MTSHPSPDNATSAATAATADAADAGTGHNDGDGDGDGDLGGAAPPSLVRGASVIGESLKTLTGSPGVYRMSAADGKTLYIGKAKNLKKRVAAYRRPQRLPVRLQRMIAATATLDVITTHTEAEALLLESNLIKRQRPHYNVLLRDDKSFPYILITGDDDWPQLVKHRGARNRKGEYFGPVSYTHLTLPKNREV